MSPYNLPAVGWTLFLVLSPVYLFRSGLPQVSDYLFAGVVVLMLLARQLRVPREAVPAMRALWAFAIYVMLVNTVWALATGRMSMVQVPLFYLYNALAVAVTFALYGRWGTAFLRLTTHAVIATIFLMVLAAPLRLNLGAGRQTLFFNNPNQLGYFALLSACIFALGTRRLRVRGYVQLGMYLACLFLVVISLSKAAILGMLLLGCALTLRRPVLVGAAALVLWGAVPYLAEHTPILDNLAYRVQTIGQDRDDSWERRGYDRIANHPEYLFVGAGEGAYDRFDSVLPGELHSSWGTLVFAYGIAGTLLFALLLWRLLRGAGVEKLLLLSPVFLYGITHQGLRTTHLWLLLAFTACVVLDERVNAAAPAPAPPEPHPQPRRGRFAPVPALPPAAPAQMAIPGGRVFRGGPGAG